MRVVFTKKEADFILKEALKGRERINVSLDLGKTKNAYPIDNGFLITSESNESNIELEQLTKCKDKTIYTITEGKVLAVELFSNETNLYYKLRPTLNWPTLMLSSVPMHRFITLTPKDSAESMVNTISPIKGRVLDTCAGLGYTSIVSAQKAQSVDCFEKDPNVLEIAKYNPYSDELFTNPKITLHQESVFEGLAKFSNGYFDRIIHDPPTPTFAKELYSQEFYYEIMRVLKNGGKFYHYSPNPGKTKGNEFWKLIQRNLDKVGFRGVSYSKKASGLFAIKKEYE